MTIREQFNENYNYNTEQKIINRKANGGPYSVYVEDINNILCDDFENERLTPADFQKLYDKYGNPFYQ